MSNVALIVVRHGTTALNQENKFRGSADPPLDGSGINDAHIVAAYLAGLCTYPIIVSSSKRRAVQTATTIASRKLESTEIHPTDYLNSLNIGDLSGQDKTPENWAVIRNCVENPDEPFPGGETLNNFRARTRPVIKDGIKRGLQSQTPVILVGHSSIMHELGTMFHNDDSACLVLPGGIVTISYQNGQLCACPSFKPDLERIGKKGEIIS